MARPQGWPPKPSATAPRAAALPTVSMTPATAEALAAPEAAGRGRGRGRGGGRHRKARGGVVQHLDS